MANMCPKNCFKITFKLKRMRKIGLAIIFAFVMNMAGAQAVCKALFVGNSYTSVNNLPLTTYQLALSTGDTLIYDSSTPGGYTFNNHLNNSTTTSLIEQGNWNYVILQEQSQNPAFPIGQVQTDVLPYAAQLSDLIRLHNPDGEVMFYMTWGRKNGDTSNCPYYPPICTYEGMDSLLYHRYLLMAELNNAAVSPVGAVWHYIRDHHPEIELYSSDESHPSLAGTYAAAATFYTVLFKKNPTLITNNLTLEAATAQTIREAAEVVVFDSLNRWFEYVELNDTVQIQDQNLNHNLHIYPNPCYDYIDIESPYLEENNVTITIYNSIGMRVKTQNSNMQERLRIFTSNMPQGYYIIELSSQSITQRKSFIKK